MPNYQTQPGSTVWARHGGRCAYCGTQVLAPASDNSLGGHPHLATIDHKLLRSQGGSRRNVNVVLACQRCNVLRGNMAYQDWLKLIPDLKAMGMLKTIDSMVGVVPYNQWIRKKETLRCLDTKTLKETT